MKHFSPPLLVALCCLVPGSLLAKEPSAPRRNKEPRPVMNAQQTQALNTCLARCQEPMKGCVKQCKGSQDCNMRCGTQFSECLSGTCGELLPKAAPRP